MLFRPEGLIPSSRRAAEFHEGVHDEPLYDVEHDERLYTTERGDDRAAARDPRAAQGVRRARRRRRRRLHRSRGVDRQPDRAERRREDDVLQHAHRRLQADHGARDLRGPGPDGEAPARVHAARDRAHLPEHPALREHDGARERARRHARAPEGQPVRGDRPHAARAPRGGVGARAARASCSSSAASGAWTTRSARTSRTATSAGSRSRARSRPSRSCCCSTSRPPA